MTLLTHGRHQTGGSGRELARAFARGVGVAVSALWASMIVTSIVVEGLQSIEVEGIVLTGLVLIGVAGVAVAFRKEVVGGYVALGAGLALAVLAAFTAGRDHLLAVLVSGFPFVVTGCLFLWSAWATREQ
jgi:hypothetical protein